MWSPSPALFLATVVAVRLMAASINIVDDCDEVYNYWEPVHLLLYGSGYQTWEYAPQFALRSYWFPGAVAAAGRALLWLANFVGLEGLPRVAVWYALRGMLGLGCALSETFLYASVRDVWGRWPASGSALSAVFAVLLLSSAGMFGASTALLPNTLTMCLFAVAAGFWVRDERGAAVACGAAGVWLGVPFSIVMLAPLALYALAVDGLVDTLPWAATASLVTLLPQLLLDTALYRRRVVAVANIVLYNALSGETDSTLYGVEPWSYYAKNLLLNVGLTVPLAALAPLVLAWRRRGAAAALLAAPLVWVALMTALPHKEQRFLFPAYPLLLLGAAVAVGAVWGALRARGWRGAATLFVVAFVVANAAMGGARIAAVSRFRAAPLRVWHALQHVHNATVCLGDEWHRFPSSFWLPDDSVRMRFVASGFRGLLPKPFAPWPDSTWREPSGMNGLNQGVADERIVPLAQCDYLVAESDSVEATAARQAGARLVTSVPLLDEARSSPLLRAWYVPGLSESRVHFKDYALFRLART